jgi:hypothetical protein
MIMPAFPQCCVDNVKNAGGKLCTWDFCKRIQDRLNKYCKDAGENPCAAVPQEEMGVPCYCCCSCFAYNTPIEASLGEYVMVQDIVADVDEILAGVYHAGDAAPSWNQRVVDYSAGISAGAGEAELEFDYMYYVAYQVQDGSQPPQFVITTVDHLFLRPNGKVTPVQYLKPGDEIVNSHGGKSGVIFVVPARFKGGLHHLTFDGFNNETLDNHLLSVNGIVTADYSVQLAYSNGSLNPALLDVPSEDGQQFRASEDAYQARYANKEALDFVADKSRWPVGLTPLASEPMINVPIYAKSFLTADQAGDIQRKAPMLPKDNTSNVTTALWLFGIFGSLFPGPIYLVDWKNDLPNAYTWEVNRQRFILFTGGLLRVQKFNQDGLSLVLAHVVAVATGVQCVGPADYDAVFSKMRQVWRNSLYQPTFRAAFDQVSALFGFVDADHSHADPANICAQPSLKCRLRAMEAGASMGPLPDCANPDIYFGLVSAKSGRQLRFVNLTFNSLLNKETAETTDNYTVTSADGTTLAVETAELSSFDPKDVRLKVSLEPLTDYKVVVKNVLSEAETPIDPAHSSATFSTRKRAA